GADASPAPAAASVGRDPGRGGRAAGAPRPPGGAPGGGGGAAAPGGGGGRRLPPGARPGGGYRPGGDRRAQLPGAGGAGGGPGGGAGDLPLRPRPALLPRGPGDPGGVRAPARRAGLPDLRRAGDRPPAALRDRQPRRAVAGQAVPGVRQVDPGGALPRPGRGGGVDGGP